MRSLRILYCILALGFTLGIYQGKLALWKNGSSLPAEIFPLYVCTLPEADQKLLETGIPMEDIRQLSAYLEDYFS